jgi:DNA-binding XRE family transcriptional regulator
MIAMNTTSDVIARIRGYASEHDIKKSALAVMAGLNNKALQNIWEDSWNPTKNTLIALEALIPSDFQVPANDQGQDRDEAA